MNKIEEIDFNFPIRQSGKDRKYLCIENAIVSATVNISKPLSG